MDMQTKTATKKKFSRKPTFGGDVMAVFDYLRPRGKMIAVSVTVMSAFLMTTAAALEIGADVSAGGGYTGNISKVEVDPVDELIAIVGFRLDIKGESQRFKVDIKSNALQVHYDKKNFDDELLAGLRAFIETKLIEDSLTWVIQDNFGHQAIDPLKAVNPDNRDNVNFFTTGPNLRLPLGLRNSLGLDLRFVDIRYSERPFDNQRRSARLWLGRQVRQNARVSLNGFASRTEFSEGTAIDFEHREAFFRFDGESRRNTYGFDIGYTELKVGTDTSDGYLLRADWIRAVTGVSEMVLRGGTRFSDEGNIFSVFQNITRGIGETENIDGVGHPFRNNFFNLAYNTLSTRTWISVQVGWSQEDYELGFDRDRDIMWGGLLVERDLSNRTFMNFKARFDRRDYKYLDRKDDDIRIRLSFGYRFGPNVSLLLTYRFEQRNSTAAADYKEHQGFLTFTYTPDWGQMKRR